MTLFWGGGCTEHILAVVPYISQTSYMTLSY